MPFFRSAPTCGSGDSGYLFGSRNVRQQINTLTAFIDVGQVYGADDAKALLVRDLSSDKGLLKVNAEHNDQGRELLPFNAKGANLCATRGRITNDSSGGEVPCFLAGESRGSLPATGGEPALFTCKLTFEAHLKLTQTNATKVRGNLKTREKTKRMVLLTSR